MKKTLTQLVGILGGTLVLLAGGCTENSVNNAQGEHGAVADVVTATYSEVKGLFVPKSTARFIGLRVADVSENQFAAAMEFKAQIYRAAENAARSPSTAVASHAQAVGWLTQVQAGRMTNDQTVTAQLENKSLRARIQALKPLSRASNAVVEVLVAIEDPDAQLTPGREITVVLPLPSQETVITVPRSALLRAAEGNFVYAVSGEHYVRTPVEAGAITEEQVEIIDGLYEGDQVVVEPVLTLWLTELQAIRGGKACADGH